MLDKFRENPITWDKASRKVYEPLRASAGDNKGRKLSVQVVNGGVIEDLSGASLSLFWETKDKAYKGLDAFDPVDATKGEFEIYYTTGMLSNEGTLNANLVLVDTSGRVVSEPFTITVFKGIDDDAIQSSDSFTALTEALIDISNLEQNYAPRLNDLTAQLQQIEPYVDTTFKNSMSDRIRKVISDTASGTANGVFIEVGDSTRASYGAHIFGFLSNELSKYDVKTYLVARSGLKAEHWSKYTANMQPGFPTVDDVIALIPGDGTNAIVDICLGINDGSKTQEQIQLYIQTGINAILSAKPNVLINLTSPNRYSDATVVNKLINVYKNLAVTGKYGYINVLENVFRTWNSDVQATYFEDTTHPNVLGQTRMADYIIPKFLPNYKTAVSQSDDVTVLSTGDTPVNYYVELATITLKRRYYGFSGTILVQASPGNSLMPANATFAFSVTQYTDLGTDADKKVVLQPLINETETLNFTRDSLVLRTVSVSESETVVKVYLKNTGITGRYFKVVFFGAKNDNQGYVDVSVSNDLNGKIAMENLASGTFDVTAAYHKYNYLSSPDGSLFRITVDNTGSLSATKM